MFGHNRYQWPSPSAKEIISRSKLLIIDDQEFPYKQRLQKEGYHITKWNVVRNLGDLENGNYDLILLDLQGVATRASAEDGIGILRHIREVSPNQLVIAFSSADFPLQYQQFFDMADGVLPKSADYGDFKAKIDGLLLDRFRRGFYLDKVDQILGGSAGSVPKVQRYFDKAVVTGDTSQLRSYLSRKLRDPESIEAVISLAVLATKALSLFMHVV